MYVHVAHVSVSTVKASRQNTLFVLKSTNGNNRHVRTLCSVHNSQLVHYSASREVISATRCDNYTNEPALR